MKLLAIRNGLWYALSTVIAILTGLAGASLIPRSLTTADEYGLFSYYLWLAGIIGLLGSLALPSALTKITSELRGQQQQQEAQALSQGVTLFLLAINLIMTIAVLLWAFEAPPPDNIFLLIVAIVILPNAVAAVLRSVLMGDERYGPVSLTATVASIVQLLLIGVAFLFKLGAAGFVAAMLFGSSLQVIGLLLAFRRAAGSFSLRFVPTLPSRATLNNYLAFVMPSTICMISTQIVWERSEMFFLTWFNVETAQIGFYGLGYTVFNMFFLLGGALLGAFLPSISFDYGAGNWQAIRSKVYQGTLLATLYSVPLSFGGWVTMGQLIPWLSTEKMYPAVPVVQVLFAGLLPGTIGIILGVVLGAAGGIWMSARLGIIVSVVNIVLDIILIPQLYAVGGAVASTVAQTIYVVLMFLAVRQLYSIELPWATIAKIVLVGALTTFLVPLLVEQMLPPPWGIIGAIGAGGVLYLGSVWLLGYLKPFFEEPAIDIVSPRPPPGESQAPISS